MKRITLLDNCARIEGHEAHYRLLRQCCGEVSDWEEVIVRAELEGVGPLAKKHLDESESPVPASARRSFTLLQRRHQHEARVRSEMLAEVLEHFDAHGLTPILIKGSALAFTTYPDPSLRPMRDMDLLFRLSEVDTAQQLLREMGYAQSNAPIPPGHYHLPSLSKKVHGAAICFELHRGIYPNCPPWYPAFDFEQMLGTAQYVDLYGTKVPTLGNLETLDYIYQHGFRAPLTYESFRLINAADLIGFIEKNCKSLDFTLIQKRYPLLYRALPYMQCLTPWDQSRVDGAFPLLSTSTDMSPVPFTGWPQRRLKRHQADGQRCIDIFASTFFPPRWWMAVYYGAHSPGQRFLHLLWHHPRHVLWWVRMFRAVSSVQKKERKTETHPTAVK